MILLLLAMASDPAALMLNARTLLAPQEAEAPARRSTYRIDDDDSSVTPTAKDRAIGDDGSRCNVVGARRCTRRGRTLFRTDLSR